MTDAFTFQTASGTDPVTAVSVTLAALYVPGCQSDRDHERRR